MINGAKLGGSTGAIAPLVFWSRSLEKSGRTVVCSSIVACNNVEIIIAIFILENLLNNMIFSLTLYYITNDNITIS